MIDNTKIKEVRAYLELGMSEEQVLEATHLTQEEFNSIKREVEQDRITQYNMFTEW